MNIFRPFQKLWFPPSPQIARGTGGGLLRKTTGALGRDLDCCCGEIATCERFRGNASLSDVHAHDSSIWVRFPAWGNASPYYVPSGSVDNNCCETLAADYELPIRDYTDTSPEYGEFTYWPGMFMPTCMPCHDCEDLSNEDFTFAYLFAHCNSCDPPEGIDTTGCRFYPELVPEGYDPIWTVEIVIYGYYNSECGTGTCSDDYPSGSTYKLLIVYQAYALSSAAPHNYAGGFELNRVLVDAPDDGFPPNDWAQFYCESPETCELYAGFAPPAP